MGKHENDRLNENGEAWMVSIPYSNTAEIWREIGNAFWLFVGLTDLVTQEHVCSGVRVGAVLGGTRLSDKLIARRIGPAFQPFTIRKWRRRLLKAGLVIQRRIPAGLQLAVIGTKKFSKPPSADAPEWIAEQVSEIAGETDPTGSLITTQLGRFNGPNGVAYNDPTGSEQYRHKEDLKRDAPSIPQGMSERFNSFWEAYPRKVGKGKARQVFLKIKPDDNLLSKMLETLDAWKLSMDWNREGGRFIPHPATWINQERWNDDPPSQRSAFAGLNVEDDDLNVISQSDEPPSTLNEIGRFFYNRYSASKGEALCKCDPCKLAVKEIFAEASPDDLTAAFERFLATVRNYDLPEHPMLKFREHFNECQKAEPVMVAANT